jgi:hypothetical protein
MKLREQFVVTLWGMHDDVEILADKLLSLPLPNWIVKEKCPCEYLTNKPASLDCEECHGTSIITRPALLSDLERDDVRLRRKDK